MAHCFDVVPIGIQHEGCVIVGVILRPEAWATIGFASGSQGGAIKGIYLVSSLGPESKMKALAGNGRLQQTEFSGGVFFGDWLLTAEYNTIVVKYPPHAHGERRQRCGIERATDV